MGLGYSLGSPQNANFENSSRMTQVPVYRVGELDYLPTRSDSTRRVRRSTTVVPGRCRVATARQGGRVREPFSSSATRTTPISHDSRPPGSRLVSRQRFPRTRISHPPRRTSGKFEERPCASRWWFYPRVQVEVVVMRVSWLEVTQGGPGRGSATADHDRMRSEPRTTMRPRGAARTS